jgi:hypothetical protein
MARVRLENLGKTCYVNALLQMLFTLRRFDTIGNFNGHPLKLALCQTLFDMRRVANQFSLRLSTQLLYSPKLFIETLWKTRGSRRAALFPKKTEQDVDELLDYLLQKGLLPTANCIFNETQFCRDCELAGISQPQTFQRGYGINIPSPPGNLPSKTIHLETCFREFQLSERCPIHEQTYYSTRVEELSLTDILFVRLTRAPDAHGMSTLIECPMNDLKVGRNFYDLQAVVDNINSQEGRHYIAKTRVVDSQSFALHDDGAIAKVQDPNYIVTRQSRLLMYTRKAPIHQ